MTLCHVESRLMSRFPGVCPGVAYRCIETHILSGTLPLITDGVNGIRAYRLTLPHGVPCLVLARNVPLYLITVMTLPARIRFNARSFFITETTIEKAKHVELSDDQRGCQCGTCPTCIGLLRDTKRMCDSTAETSARSEKYRGHLGTSLRRRRYYTRLITDGTLQSRR